LIYEPTHNYISRDEHALNQTNSQDNGKCGSICEARNCYKEATNIIKVNAGKFGYITLSLCSQCVDDF
jgi:hypothetical protein